MLRFVIGAFIVLHGLVHLLYFGQSRRLFELQPGMVWPDGSWAFSRLLGDGATRSLAAFACVVAALGFAVGGAGILLGQAWWRCSCYSGPISASSPMTVDEFFSGYEASRPIFEAPRLRSA
jgi:hypothetical protein